MAARKGTVSNPKGKGGFGDHPENRNSGRWSKETSYSYQLNRFREMTMNEIREYLAQGQDDMKPAEIMALQTILGAISKDEATSIARTNQFADRTEGKPTQTIIPQTSDDGLSKIQIEFK